MPNEQVTPLARALPLLIEKKVREEINRRGQAIPGHVISVAGPIVTVSFDIQSTTIPQVQMPLFGPEYIRYPIQPGDLGVCFPVDFYTGGVSGLGTGEADTTPQGNLSTLVWFPCGNKNWTAVDPNAVTLYGPNGVVLRDTQSETVVTLTPGGINAQSAAGQFTFGAQNITIQASGTLTLTGGGKTVTINSSGVTIDGILWETHTHGGVESGGSNTGPPV